MNSEQQSVREFHRVFGATINDKPTVPSEQDQQLRGALIEEERKEYSGATDLVEVADALGDLLYVVYGAGVTYGIDLEPVFQEIHRSNMTKLWLKEELPKMPEGTFVQCVADGERAFLVKRVDGKVIKSPSYSPADIKGVLERQGYTSGNEATK